MPSLPLFFVVCFMVNPSYGQETSKESPERQISILPSLKIESLIAPIQQQNEEDILSSIDSFGTNLTNTDNVFSESLIDSFEQLDFDEIFEDEIFEDEETEWPQVSFIIESLIKKPQGVGVKGVEEAIINQLDKSDLMDFDVDEYFWRIELIEKKSLSIKPSILNEIETIDLPYEP